MECWAVMAAEASSKDQFAAIYSTLARMVTGQRDSSWCKFVKHFNFLWKFIYIEILFRKKFSVVYLQVCKHQQRQVKQLLRLHEVCILNQKSVRWVEAGLSAKKKVLAFQAIHRLKEVLACEEILFEGSNGFTTHKWKHLKILERKTAFSKLHEIWIVNCFRCVVDVIRRNQCQSCRLNKCLQVTTSFNARVKHFMKISFQASNLAR